MRSGTSQVRSPRRPCDCLAQGAFGQNTTIVSVEDARATEMPMRSRRLSKSTRHRHASCAPDCFRSAAFKAPVKFMCSFVEAYCLTTVIQSEAITPKGALMKSTFVRVVPGGRFHSNRVTSGRVVGT